VMSQRPAAGAFISGGGKMHLVVSRGPPPVPIPDVTGQPAGDAQARLEQAGFVVTVRQDYDDLVANNLVIGTDPAKGASAPRESEIVLIVSKGAAPVQVPDVSGRTYDDAAGALAAQGFKATRNDVFDDRIDVGKVVATDPPGGQLAPKNSNVTVNVSKGPEMVSVPQGLVGKTVEQASQMLQAVGLTPDVENYAPGKTVRAVSPKEGTQVKKGSKVSLIL